MHEPIPKDMEYFWPLNDNKTKLQVLMYDTITQHASENGNYTDIVLGSIQDNRMATKVINKIVHNVPELNSPYEEADVSLVLHAAEAAKAGAKRLVLLSADTDIRVLKLWFSWLQAIERYIPIHKLALKLGADFCKVLPAVHALNGCDYSSKTGTKAVVLKANPVSEVFRIILDPNVCFQSTGSKCWILLVSILQKTNSSDWHKQAEIVAIPSYQTYHPPLLTTLKRCSTSSYFQKLLY